MGGKVRLLARLRTRLTWVSERGWMVVRALHTGEQVRPRLKVLTEEAGFRSRYQLAYHLKRNGLPPYRELAGWMALLGWVETAENEGRSLCAQTLAEGLDPAYRYRMAKRLTGLGWRELCDQGLDWTIDRFVEACSPPPPA